VVAQRRGRAPDPVRAGDPEWWRCGVALPAATAPKRSETERCGRGIRSRGTSSIVPPAPLLLLYTRSATGVHNHESISALIRARGETGVGIGPVLLDACWGQSNILPLDLNLKY
jgi:hypothetical protein